MNKQKTLICVFAVIIIIESFVIMEYWSFGEISKVEFQNDLIRCRSVCMSPPSSGASMDMIASNNLNNHYCICHTGGEYSFILLPRR